MRIRPLHRDDIPDIVRIRRLAFRSSERPSDASLADYYVRVFLENPWRDEALPSLVAEDGTGHPSGFLGVLPRPMRFLGQPIRVAITTEFMVTPGERGAGLALLAAALRGPQDLTLADRANDAALTLFRAHGGTAALWYSLYWSHPLGFGTRAIAHGSRGGFRRAVGVARRWASRGLGRLAGGTLLGRSPAGELRELDGATLAALLDRVGPSYQLAPAYDAATASWLLDRLSEKAAHRELHKHVVIDVQQRTIGWFVYLSSAKGRAEVVQMAANEGCHDLVFDHLWWHASNAGAATLGGRLDPPFVPCLRRRRVELSLAEPWTIMHTERPELAAALQDGTAFFSRLDGEWWLSS